MLVGRDLVRRGNIAIEMGHNRSLIHVGCKLAWQLGDHLNILLNLILYHDSFKFLCVNAVVKVVAGRS